MNKNVLDLIGNTPLVELNNIKNHYDLPFNLYAKVERNNPSGSIKDRAAKEIILDGIKEGKINKDTLIIEATSGNTGISLAMICASLNLKCKIVMPENSSKERILMMKAYGADVILTPASLGMKGSVDKAEELTKTYKNFFKSDQFNNLSNFDAHYKYTGKEIYDGLNGKIDVFIDGFGTGGTLSGVGKYLKEKNSEIKVIGVEPLASPLITKGKSGPHLIQGIGANFIPENLKLDYVDEVIDISDEEAYEGARILAQKEGLLCGISSGASLMGAIKLDKEKYKGKNVVIILPDNGERYLSIGGLYE